jgi:hypothetical protein
MLTPAQTSAECVAPVAGSRTAESPAQHARPLARLDLALDQSHGDQAARGPPPDAAAFPQVRVNPERGEIHRRRRRR